MNYSDVPSSHRATLRKRTGGLFLVAAFAALVLTVPAFAAAPGLPRTYDVTPIESANPLPGGGGNFGWGVTSADVTGDGKSELFVAQSQSNVPGYVFIYDGVTNKFVDQLFPPERNAPPASGITNEEFAFVYIEQMPDLGSCVGGTPGGINELCPDARVGPQDGIPEIIAGSRALRVGTCTAPATTCPELGRTGVLSDPTMGRAYVFDGKTRAVLKKIDMPLVHRQSQVLRGGAGAFGRFVMTPAGLPPCAGPASEGNNAGVGPCDFPTFEVPPPGGSPPGTPSTQVRAKAVEIGDADGLANNPATASIARADLFISSRGYRYTSTSGTNAQFPNGVPNTAPAGSQCATAAPAFNNTSGNCTGGAAFYYRGEEIANSDPREILDGTVDGQVAGGSRGIENLDQETVRILKNPFAQVPGQEFSGGMWRIGDVARCSGPAAAPNTHQCTSQTFNPDGVPDFIVADDQVDFPLAAPDTTSWQDVGAAYLFDGKTGLLIFTYSNPQPQPRAGYTDSFNPGFPAGNMGHSLLPDFVTGSSTHSVKFIGDGRGFISNGEATNGRGAQIGVLDDPTPKPAGQFGSSQTGVGNLVDGAQTPNNEIMMGSYSPFGVSTEAAAELLSDVTIFNGITARPLQSIPDPVQERGSGFGMGMAPMGDLNSDGFLDFAISSYLSNLPGQPADGRAYIFRSNNKPLPAPPKYAQPSVVTPKILRPGSCTNDTLGTARNDRLKGTVAGDRMLGYGGDDRIEGLEENDCLDGGTGSDRLLGGPGVNRLLGGSGTDRLLGGGERDRMFGQGGNDRLKGGIGPDVMAGGRGNDRLDGGRHTDRIYGEAGSDRLIAGSGRNFLDGGTGNDRIYARNDRRDVISCGSGRDRVQADRTDIVRVDCERISRAKRRATR